jgi:hypothetical protein
MHNEMNDAHAYEMQKCNLWEPNTWGVTIGINKARPECVKIGDLAQAAPMVSFSHWRELRISCHREAI